VLIVALTFIILWGLSFWLLMVERRRPISALLLQPLALMSGTVLFFVLSVTGLLLLRLLIAD